MTRTPVNRREVLKTVVGVGLVGSGMTTSAAAKRTDVGKGRGGRGKEALQRTPLYFSVYAGRGDSSVAFGFSDSPTPFRGYDVESEVFDASSIEVTPNGQTLHYGFRFLPNYALVGTPKPYVLKHEGDGKYEARGQRVNFELGSRAPEPFSFLAEGKWRAVGKDIVQLSEPGGMVESAVTRVDFYTREPTEYVRSFVYVLWADGVGSGVRDPRNPHLDLPDGVAVSARELIAGGQLNEFYR